MSKKEDATIEKIVLDLSGKKVELTVEQAKKLASALHEMFGPKEVVEKHYHDWWNRPWRWYSNSGTLKTESGVLSEFKATSNSLYCKV